jgi:valyl-tRNA synthetase
MLQAGLFDAGKELARLAKQRVKLEKEAGALGARIANPAFVQNAAEAVVAEVRAQHAEAAEKLAAIDAKIAEVKALAVGDANSSNGNAGH